MAGWNDLPFEIKSLVLQHLLDEAIERLTPLQRPSLYTRYDRNFHAEWETVCHVATLMPEMREELINLAKSMWFARRHAMDGIWQKLEQDKRSHLLEDEEWRLDGYRCDIDCLYDLVSALEDITLCELQVLLSRDEEEVGEVQEEYKEQEQKKENSQKELFCSCIVS